MYNKKLAAAVISAMVFGTSSAMAAPASDLFQDVPTDHWAYSAVMQLAKDGILTGYSDQSFQGDKTITRYEMAQIVANARTHLPKASEPDQDLINKLSDEFRDDLDALGVRVTRLEKKQANVRITGSAAQKYERAKHEGITNSDGSTVSPHWRKEIKLNLDADVPKTPLTFHGTFTTQMDSYKGSGFNSEETEKETWNGGQERPNVMRPETYYVGGPIDKTGLDGKFGAFYTGVQNDFVNHAVMRGFDISHKDDKNWFSVFTGRIDARDSEFDSTTKETSTTTTEGGSTSGTGGDIYNANKDIFDNQMTYTDGENGNHVGTYQVKTGSSASPKTDFLRHNSYAKSGSSTVTTYKRISPSDWDWNGTEMYKTTETTGATPATRTRRTLTGAAFGHRFTDRLDAEAGYYAYTSAAYDENALRIYALSANHKIGRKGNLYAAYAHGNQGGYNQAWTAEYQFNGGENMSAEPNHAFGYYFGYRYLAPDALVKTVYEDGAQIGQRGWEGGLVYNFCHNLQGLVKYFYGSSITNPGFDRSKWFSSLTFNF